MNSLANRGAPGAPRSPALVVALVPAGMAPAAPRADPRHRRRRRGGGGFSDGGQRRRRHRTPSSELRARSSELDGSDPAAVRATIEARASKSARSMRSGTRQPKCPGSREPIEVRAQDPEGPFGQPMLALLDGRYPKAPDEVALTDEAASLLSAHIGERVELGGVDPDGGGHGREPDRTRRRVRARRSRRRHGQRLPSRF